MQSPRRVVALVSSDNKTVNVDRQLLFELAPTLDLACCASFKVGGVDGQMLERFVELLYLYCEHDCKQQPLPATTHHQLVVPDPMWDFIESLPHGALIFALKTAQQLKTCSVYNFVSTIGFFYSLKHPHRDAMDKERNRAKRCLVCYPQVGDPAVCWSGKYATKFFEVFEENKESAVLAQASCAKDSWDAKLLANAVQETQRIEQLENGSVLVEHVAQIDCAAVSATL